MKCNKDANVPGNIPTLTEPNPSFRFVMNCQVEPTEEEDAVFFPLPPNNQHSLLSCVFQLMLLAAWSTRPTVTSCSLWLFAELKLLFLPKRHTAKNCHFVPKITTVH